MKYPALEKILRDRALLFDEIKMWMRLGMYITSEPVWNTSMAKYVVKLFDGMANECLLTQEMGKNLRIQILSWWEVERTKPRANEPVDSSGLSELENRSAI